MVFSKSNEDHTKKISQSVFVTNFPDATQPGDLWKVCSAYGTVIDVFIPNKRAKSGKRFALVRFIKVSNLTRLLENLCTIWISRYHLYANQARFERPQKPNSSLPKETSRIPPKVPNPLGHNLPPKPVVNRAPSFVSALVAMVLGDECVGNRELENCVMGKVKDFASINNLYVLLSNEAPETCVPRERIVWVDIEGVPLHVWSRATFSKIERFKIIARGKVFILRDKELFVWSPSFKAVKETDYCSNEDVIKVATNNIDDDGNNVNGDANSDVECVSNIVFADQEDILGHVSPHKWHSAEKKASSVLFNLNDLINRQGMQTQGAANSDGLSSYVMEDAQPINAHDSPIGEHNTKTGSSMLDVLKNMIKPLTCKRMLWDYISTLINRWDGHCLVMGDFNEVGYPGDRMGTMFNAQGANKFNCFISNSGLIEVQLEGCSFTWSHFSAKKMSKLDRFFYQMVFSPFSLICRLRASIETFRTTALSFCGKWSWITGLLLFEFFIPGSAMRDKGGSNDDVLLERMDMLKKLNDIHSAEARDRFQKAKIQWAIEGDENSKFFHGIINRKRNNLAVKGVMVDGEWLDEPCHVKEEFRLYFANWFSAPSPNRCKLNFIFPNKLSPDLASDLERLITQAEVRSAVWGCGKNKSLGPDGFTFEFFANIGIFLEMIYVLRLIGSSSTVRSLEDLIPPSLPLFQKPKTPSSQILDGPFIINELLYWCKYKKQQAMVFKVDFAKAYDSVMWDFLDDMLDAFGFGSKWRLWIRGSLYSGMASGILNGSPSLEFKFHRGLKQGDPLAPYLFILIMESFHLSISKAVDTGIFRGINISDDLNISHLFYADDAVFIGEWVESNLSGITQILRCFSLLLGLNINLYKSHLLGVGVSFESVSNAASIISCSTMRTPFKYLGVMVGDNTSKVHAWDDTISKAFNLELHPQRNFSAQRPRWTWDLNSDKVFRVKDVRYLLYDHFLPKVATATRWVNLLLVRTPSGLLGLTPSGSIPLLKRKLFSMHFTQEMEIHKMRLRFATKILTHDINMHIEKMSDEAHAFAKKHTYKQAKQNLIRDIVVKRKKSSGFVKELAVPSDEVTFHFQALVVCTGGVVKAIFDTIKMEMHRLGELSEKVLTDNFYGTYNGKVKEALGRVKARLSKMLQEAACGGHEVMINSWRD
nr:putative RNA-directed DNA polymerase, eukaryota, reverse transcriptase zinc-binding domain protein [Tanacetum cinerariifolium]